MGRLGKRGENGGPDSMLRREIRFVGGWEDASAQSSAVWSASLQSAHGVTGV